MIPLAVLMNRSKLVFITWQKNKSTCFFTYLHLMYPFPPKIPPCHPSLSWGLAPSHTTITSFVDVLCVVRFIIRKDFSTTTVLMWGWHIWACCCRWGESIWVVFRFVESILNKKMANVRKFSSVVLIMRCCLKSGLCCTMSIQIYCFLICYRRISSKFLRHQ